MVFLENTGKFSNLPWYFNKLRTCIHKFDNIWYNDRTYKSIFRSCIHSRFIKIWICDSFLSFRRKQISRNGNYSKKLQTKLCKSADFHLTLVRSECLEVAPDTGASFRQDKEHVFTNLTICGIMLAHINQYLLLGYNENGR